MKQVIVNIYRKKLDYIVYTMMYIMSFILSREGHHYLSGLVLILTSLFLFAAQYLKTGKLVGLYGLFALSWIGGQGIACLQLSKLQTDWNLLTWICFFLAFIGFRIGYEFKIKSTGVSKKSCNNNEIHRRILLCIVAIAAVSMICFIIEFWKVKFIPLFSELPHAYSYFHVSGVHYFTISCVLIPALTVLYLKDGVKKYTNKTKIILFICNIIAISIPILCVSRFQLLFAVLFALVIYIAIYNKISIKMIITLLAIMIPAYILLTIARNHDISYLNSIFEMKNKKMPIFITQPYMYVANNYENFNCLVENLTKHSHGIRMLFPFFALTGLKFLFPQVTQFPNYLTKPELTTFTMYYDSYYDFGILGVIILAILIGVAASILESYIEKKDNPIIFLFYGQFSIYLALSFFTTWFSNPTTWFWFVMTTGIYMFVGYDKYKKH